MVTVSVILPYRDAGRTLERALCSILAQGMGDLELLLVDDGSVDGSRKMAAGFKDPRVRLIGNAGNPGIVGALATGVAASRGEWIARMDADDDSHPDRLGRCLDLAWKRPEAGVIGCRVELENPLGSGMERHVAWVNSLLEPKEISRSRFIECPLVHPSVMMKREWLERAGGYREIPWAEDHDLWLRMLEAGCRIVKTPEVLLKWRDSESRLTRRDPRYGEAARMAMRAHFLGRLERIRKAGVVIAGAGPLGKSLLRALQAEGVEVAGIFEVNPRRIGQRIHGVEVAAAEELGWRWRDAVLLGAVGLEGRRELIRRQAVEAGRREGEDFWSVC